MFSSSSMPLSVPIIQACHLLENGSSSTLSRWPAPNNLHIYVISHPEIDISTALEPLISLRVSFHEQSGQRNDIIEYVISVVYSNTRMQRWREEDKRLVIETLSERADGI